MTEPSQPSRSIPRLPPRTPEERTATLLKATEVAKKKLAARQAQKQAFLDESKSKRWIEKMLKG